MRSVKLEYAVGDFGGGGDMLQSRFEINFLENGNPIC